MADSAIELIKKGIFTKWLEPNENDIAYLLYSVKQERLAGSAIEGLLEKLTKLEKKIVRNNFLLEEVLLEEGYLYLLKNDLTGFKSVINKLEALEPKPIDKISFLKGIQSFRASNYQSALEHLQHVVKTTKSDLYRGRALNNLGIIFHKIDQKHAEMYYLKAIESFHKLGNASLEIQAKENLASLYKSMGKIDDAIGLLQEISAQIEKANAMDELAQNLHNLGVLFELKGNYNSALGYYQKALKIRENMDDQISTSWTYMKLAKLFLMMGELSSAVELAHKCLIIREKNGTKEEIAQVLQLLALIYHQLGDFENAKSCLKQSMNLYLETANEEWYSDSIFYLTTILLDQGSVDEAIRFAEIHDQITSSQSSPTLKQKNQLLQAMVLKHKDSPKSKFEALEMLEQLLQEEHDDFEFSLRVLIEIADLYLLEMKVSGAEKTMGKLESILSKMLEHSLENHSYLLYVHFLILNSRMKAAQLKGEDAIKLLKEAKQVCEEQGMLQMRDTIEKEIDTLQNDLISMWETLKQSNADLLDRIQQSAVMEYLDKVTNLLRLNRD